ncbi:MAG: hypothetical protein ABTA16_15365 [Niallia sp.]
MKEIIYSATIVLLLVGCNDNSPPKNMETIIENNETSQSTNSTIAADDTTDKVEEPEDKLEETETKEVKDDSKIDTSIFDLAKEINVTDARDITQHISLQIILKDAVKQGNGVQGVLTQAYDFLQQEDIAGANTITIFVNSGQLKIFQITIDTSKFKTDDEISMIKLVLDASEIEKMTDEVKSYGEALELW